jgi:hypothetical protein
LLLIFISRSIIVFFYLFIFCFLFGLQWRTEWTEEEKLRTLVQSGDLDGIMKVYCDQTGVNPFKFPPRV